jgi:hypothetical protein
LNVSDARSDQLPDPVLGSDPYPLLGLTSEELYAIPAEDVEAFRLRAARAMFERLRPGVRFLDKLATNQGIERIDSLDDVVPVLFAHTAYKSYPLALLERSDFTRLTHWLGQLTLHDVSHIDVSGIESIEDWLSVLDAKTPLRIVTTSGTSGKLSFLPRSLDEMPAYHGAFRHLFLPYREERGVDVMASPLPLVHFGYRHGYSSVGRRLQSLEQLHPDLSDRLYAIYPGKMSPDLMALAGRMAGAAARGESIEATISPALRARRDGLLTMQKERDSHLRAFVERIDTELRGEQVLTVGGWTSVIDAAMVGEELGVSDVFSPDSLVLAGGGLKGRPNTPDDYEDRVLKFMGVSSFYHSYGMSEQTAFTTKCVGGYYHMPAYILPFVVDPDSGEPLPRYGTVSGRFAFLDLFPKTHWGGFISGDAVTMLWDGECSCGREGARLSPDVTRFSELRGGDDRITCAGAADAYDRALEYVLRGL